MKQQSLGIAQAWPRRDGASALPDPRSGRHPLYNGKHRIAHLRQQVNVLVAVNEVRRPPKGRAESGELVLGFGRQRTGIEPPQQPGGERTRKAEECAVLVDRAVGRCRRAERRRQGEVQPDRSAAVGAGKVKKRPRLRPKSWASSPSPKW